MNKRTIIFCAGAPHVAVEKIKEHKEALFIGVDRGASVLNELNITVDYAIGDFDSSKVPPAKTVITLPREKDDTDLHYALNYILNVVIKEPTTVDHIFVYGALGGGRLDHTVANLFFVFQKRFERWLSLMTFIEKTAIVNFYLPGHYTLYKESDKPYLSFVGLTPLENVTYIGAKYPLKHAYFQTPVSLISNEFLTEEMSFEFSKGILCVMQTHDSSRNF